MNYRLSFAPSRDFDVRVSAHHRGPGPEALPGRAARAQGESFWTGFTGFTGLKNLPIAWLLSLHPENLVNPVKS